LMRDFKNRMPKPVAPKPAAPKPTTTPAPATTAKPTPAAKPTPTARRPLTSAAPPTTGAAATDKLKKFTEGVDVFDVILTHLIEQGFSDDEALVLMTSMSEEKRQQMLSLINEEESDALKDRRQERGGVDGNTDYRRPAKSAPKGEKKGKTPLQKDAEEKYGKGASAMDIVRAKIKAQYGDKAIKDTKKD
jgi:hypothetical protein